VLDLAMTTNGTALPGLAAPLREAGLARVNISLDTMRRDRYAEITRRDALARVLSGIEAAVRAELSPVKINVVLLHGLFRADVDDFLSLARRMPVSVRFIERMPIGCSSSEAFVSAEGVRERILSLPGARESRSGESSPAVTYEIPGFAGNLGIISPVSRRFCDRCNRLRVTADGRLRGCLFARKTLDLRAVLRSGRGDEAVAEILRTAVRAKPEGHQLCGGGDGSSSAEPMSRVGG
jgi:cyclic pyranopterin phosphate synthase